MRRSIVIGPALFLVICLGAPKAASAKDPPVCQLAWKRAAASGAKSDYQAYIEKCPKGDNVRKARAIISPPPPKPALKPKPSEPTSAPSDKERIDACDARWRSASRKSTSTGYENFARTCPTHVSARQARMLAESLKCEESYAKAAQLQNLSAMYTHLRTCSSHSTSDAARRDIATIEADPFFGLQLIPFGSRKIPRESLTVDAIAQVNSCEAGDAYACASIGYKFSQGKGAPRDSEWGATLFGWACIKGSANGCGNLAVHLVNGSGIERDNVRATLFKKKGCDGGALFACNLLAFDYRYGRYYGIDIDYRVAAELFEKACNDGKSGGYASGCLDAARMLSSEEIIFLYDFTRANALINAGLKIDPNNSGLLQLRDEINSKPPAFMPVRNAKELSCNVGPYIIFFGHDSARIGPEAVSVLRNAALAYRNCGNAKVQLEGHTDRSGRAEYNLRHSESLAQRVKQQFIRMGLPASRISVSAFGESQPRVPTPDGVQELQNRRVEIFFIP